MTTTNLYAPPGAAVADVVGADAFTESAGRGVRLGAAILDGIIFAGMVYLPLMVAVGIALSAASDGGGDPEAIVGEIIANGGTNPVIIVGGLLTLAGLIAWCWLTITYVARNGQSIAKKLLHIKVVRRDGSRASLSRIFWLRNVVSMVVGFVPLVGVLYSIVDALFIFGETRQCLHDKIADTIVIKD